MHVITKQPSLVQRQNLLLELNIPGKTLHLYHFDYLYANVCLYGLPREARTPSTINEILYQIGQPDDLDEQIELDINRDKFYALAKAKLNVNRHATDKVFLPISPTRRIIIFIHYERISRICTFCVAFFHNRADCLARATKVLVDAENRNGPYGKWMTRLSTQPSALLSRLRAQCTPHAVPHRFR